MHTLSIVCTQKSVAILPILSIRIEVLFLVVFSVNLSSHLLPFLLNSQSLRVDDTPLHMAIREALANTLIHADYYMRGNTVITYNNVVNTSVDGSSQSSTETNSLNAGFKLSFANPGCLRML